MLRLFRLNLYRLHNCEKEAKARELLRVVGVEKQIDCSQWRALPFPRRHVLCLCSDHYGCVANFARFDSAGTFKDSNCHRGKDLAPSFKSSSTRELSWLLSEIPSTMQN